jgi:hypothetical protein
MSDQQVQLHFLLSSKFSQKVTRAEICPARGPNLGDLSRAAGGELQFYFFGMRLIVRTRVEPSHEYGLVCLSHNHAKLGKVRAD